MKINSLSRWTRHCGKIFRTTLSAIGRKPNFPNEMAIAEKPTPTGGVALSAKRPPEVPKGGANARAWVIGRPTLHSSGLHQ